MFEGDTKIFDKFRSLKILVIGELIIDAYLQGSCSRIAPEASIPVIDLHDKRYCLGGAANVAANLSALGAEVLFLTVCGCDDHAGLAFDLLKANGLESDFIIKSDERKTLIKTRVSSDSQLLVRIDEGSVDPLTSATQAMTIRAIEQAYRQVDAVYIADYGKGLMGEAIINAFVELNAKHPKVIALDTKRNSLYLKLKPTIVKPNYSEASKLLGISENIQARSAELVNWGKALYEKTAANYILLTADCEGVAAFEKGKFKFHKPVPKVENPKVSGAGDTFLATALMALATEADLERSVELSIAAAHHVIKQPHTSVCALNELIRASSPNVKVLTGFQEINELREVAAKQGKKIIFTNGCFDILHSGHVCYLRGAKARGDVLIVGLNNDESIRRLKGQKRPINNLDDRIEVLSALSCIDYIIPFGKVGDDTPIELVQRIKPDVFVKGGDYVDKALPEEEALLHIGCEIIFLPTIAHKSTTNTINRIREDNMINQNEAV